VLQPTNKVSKFHPNIYLKTSPGQIIVQVHLTLFSVRKMLDESSFSFFDSLMVFMTHCVSIESPNEIIFELKKSRVVVCPRMRIYRDEFLETEKREQNEKKKSLTPFGYLANVQNYLSLLFKRNKIDF